MEGRALCSSPGKPHLARTSHPSGSVTGVRVQPSSGLRQAGQRDRGWQHCLPAGGGGGLQSTLLLCRGVVGWGHPLSFGESRGCSQSRWVRQLFCPLLAQLQGDQLRLPSRHHPARCGAWGQGVPGALWLWGHTVLLTTLPLSAQQIRADPEQEVRSLNPALWGTHRGQLGPPGVALKPE